MPIKDISKEEQSHLYLAGGVKREHLQLTESDRGLKKNYYVVRNAETF